MQEVRELGEAQGGGFDYQVVASGMADKVKQALSKGLAAPDFQERRVDYVGPQVGKQLRNKGVAALLYAMVAILVYVAFRFDFKFGPGALLAMLHDVVMVAGFYLVSRREFNLTAIAALLTVIGYSVNDTIVIYDRIREDMAKYKGKPLAEVINIAVNDTLARTLLTSFVTALSLVGLLIFGVGEIWDFAMAMLVGIIVGTYSSVYIASPLVIWLDERAAAREGRAKRWHEDEDGLTGASLESVSGPSSLRGSEGPLFSRGGRRVRRWKDAAGGRLPPCGLAAPWAHGDSWLEGSWVGCSGCCWARRVPTPSPRPGARWRRGPGRRWLLGAPWGPLRRPRPCRRPRQGLASPRSGTSAAAAGSRSGTSSSPRRWTTSASRCSRMTRYPPSEVRELCPGYFEASREERKAFWALLFASIARLESGFDPESTFLEPRPLRTLSVGLLQLSYGDQERHDGCPLNPMDANITDPAVNLRCGVAILRNQLASRNTLFPRRYYYWSVLTRKREQVQRDFLQHRDQLGFCQPEDAAIR